jgi:hypothetical protein
MNLEMNLQMNLEMNLEKIRGLKAFSLTKQTMLSIDIDCNDPINDPLNELINDPIKK